MMDAELQPFAVEARRFTDWATGNDQSPMSIRAAIIHLVALYRAALELPQPWNDALEADTASVEPPTGALKTVISRVSVLPIQFYWEVFDPLEKEKPESVGGYITDDISDIYSDIARGLVLFDEQRYEEALWEWAFNFRIHWGRHLTAALCALHSYLAQESPNGLSPDAQPFVAGDLARKAARGP